VQTRFAVGFDVTDDAASVLRFANSCRGEAATTQKKTVVKKRRILGVGVECKVIMNSGDDDVWIECQKR